MKERFIIIKQTPNKEFYSSKTIEVIGEFRPDELYTIIEYAQSYKCSYHLNNGDGVYKFEIINNDYLEFKLVDYQKAS